MWWGSATLFVPGLLATCLGYDLGFYFGTIPGIAQELFLALTLRSNSWVVLRDTPVALGFEPGSAVYKASTLTPLLSVFPVTGWVLSYKQWVWGQSDLTVLLAKQHNLRLVIWPHLYNGVEISHAVGNETLMHWRRLFSEGLNSQC